VSECERCKRLGATCDRCWQPSRAALEQWGAWKWRRTVEARAALTPAGAAPSWWRPGRAGGEWQTRRPCGCGADPVVFGHVCYLEGDGQA
jgi:hypothetical protein